MQRSVVIIGGGIAGTAAGYSLRKWGYDVTIIERNNRLGGRVYSENINGSCVELGAGFLTGSYTNTFTFLKEAGLAIKLRRRKSSVLVAKNGRIIKLSAPSTMFGNSWLTFGAKLQLIKELIATLPESSKLDLHKLWKAYQFDKESISEHFHNRRGRELVDYVFDLILNSYFYWDPSSTTYAWAKLLLVRGFHTTFILEDGLSQIPGAAAMECNLLLSHEVKDVHRASDGSFKIAVLGPAGHRILSTDGVICATTARIVPTIIHELSREQQKFFSSMRYTSTAVACYQLRRKSKPKSYAITYPPKDGSPLGVATVAPDVFTQADIVKLYASRLVGKNLSTRSSATIHKTLSREIDLNLSKPFKEQRYRIQSWPEALPIFDTGSLTLLGSFRRFNMKDTVSRLVFAGDYLGGPFIEGAFTSGVEAADKLDRQLHNFHHR